MGKRVKQKRKLFAVTYHPDGYYVINDVVLKKMRCGDEADAIELASALNYAYELGLAQKGA